MLNEYGFKRLLEGKVDIENFRLRLEIPLILVYVLVAKQKSLKPQVWTDVISVNATIRKALIYVLNAPISHVSN